MDKFISCEELSKQEKRKIDHAIWQTWGKQNPVRRSPKNSKSYNRKKSGIGSVIITKPVPGLYFPGSICYNSFKCKRRNTP